jgi:hypothetical protein
LFLREIYFTKLCVPKKKWRRVGRGYNKQKN